METVPRPLQQTANSSEKIHCCFLLQKKARLLHLIKTENAKCRYKVKELERKTGAEAGLWQEQISSDFVLCKNCSEWVPGYFDEFKLFDQCKWEDYNSKF